MIKLGFVSAVVADLSFEETVDLAAAQGFDCVEMLCWPVGNPLRSPELTRGRLSWKDS